MASIAKPKKGALVKDLAPIVEQLVDFANAWMNATMSPQGIGKIQMSDGNVVIIINTTDKCP